MDIKVREVSTEEKSSQEIEQELLDKHEEKTQAETEQVESTEVKVATAPKPKKPKPKGLGYGSNWLR